jgi:Type II secretory pathway, prepilin signal peptidase PulO and related peptidases
MQQALQQFRADTKRQKQQNPKAVSVDEAVFRKKWHDYLPLLGWFGFSRFSPLLGRGFWLRPFCVELLCGLGLPLLYYWQVESRQLWVAPVVGMLPETETVLLTRFVLHAVFFSLLLLATLTDFDDFVIRDLITVPGTIFGLLAGALLTWGMLPSTEIVVANVPENMRETVTSELGLIPISAYGTDGTGLFYRNVNVPLHAASPRVCQPEMMARPNFLALGVALLCWWGWCFAGMNRVWRMSFGLKQAMALFLRRLRRSLSTWWYLLAALIGSLVIATLWNGGTHWQGAYSALLGMAVGGGMIWVVRIAGAWALKREAMGFGDVTFMAMIGAFLGWQPCVFIFFVAPLAGLVIGISRWLLGLGREMPYGPFLSLATLVVVLFWPRFWLWAEPFFELAWVVPALLLFCGVMLFVLLGLLGAIKSRIANAKS